MAINPILFSLALNESFQNGDGTATIGVPVKPNEKLSPVEVLRRAVMTALGTNDAKQADEFIRQSGIEPQTNLTRQNKNGVTFYEFPVGTDFYNSVEQFKQTGKAASLGGNASVVDTNSGDNSVAAPNTNRNSIAEKTGIDRTPYLRRRISGNPNASAQTNQRTQSQIHGQTISNGDAKPKQLTAKQYAEQQARNRAVWEYTKQGLDGGNMTIPFSLADLWEIKAATRDGDARLETLTKGLRELGYDERAIAAVLEREGITSDAKSKVELPGETADEKKDVNNWLNRTIAEWKARQSINNINFGKNVGGNSLTLGADLRKKVFLEDLRLKEGETGVKRYEQQLKLQTEISQIENEYKTKLGKAKNLLEESILVGNRDDKIKAAIDRSYADSGIDFRSVQTDAQRGANQTADTIERIVRFGLETNPATMFLPDAVKNRIVSAGIGLANGTVYLASAPQGVQDFITDRAIDALSYGANKIGINTESFDRANAQIRQARAERWQAFLNLQTANLSRLDVALDDKIRRGLPLNATDIPSLERSVGKVLPQAVIQGGIAVATGGMSIPAQVALTAAVNGGIAFGGTYAQTNDGWKAGEEAAWSAAQTATLPISKAIPGIGSEALDLATGYVVGKMRGANDVEILDQMLTQGLLGAGFKAGKKFADLTVQERQIAWQRFKSVAGEVNKAVDAQYEIAKFKFTNKAEPLKAEEGGAIYRTVDGDNQMKFLQSYRTRNGVAFLELTNEQYAKAKGTVKEVEISNRQFEAANGTRLTADGTITTINETKLAKNLDSVQGQNLREPRLVTPTTAEFIRNVEVIKGLQKVKDIRQEFVISKDKNIAYADIEVNNQKWDRVSHSGKVSKDGTALVPKKRFFKTGIEGYERSVDSEVKILEEFANKYADQRDIKGTIYLFTERPPCSSCTDIFPQFRKMFPNIKLEVASGNYIEKQGIKK